MTPQEAIHSLDNSLNRNGQDVRLQRLAANVSVAEVTIRAFVRGYAPEELVGGIAQNDSKMIFSPTPIISANWPSPAMTAANLDARVPIKGDRAFIAGKARNIEAAVGIYMDNVLVRLEAQVKG
jgi:hypothetical protein